jgi:cation-transporting ATPase E
VFSLLLASTTLIISVPYPITPSQLSLINVMTIGIPSFVLALAPDRSLVRGKFIKNILIRALPAGITDYLAVFAALEIAQKMGYSSDVTATMATIIMGAVGFFMLFTVCRPFTLINKALFITMLVGFILFGTVLHSFFELTAIPWSAVGIVAGIIVLCVPVMYIITVIIRRCLGKVR